MKGLGLGLGMERGGGFRGILDKVKGAVAAYSLRKLTGKYRGPCLRVHRSSDNAETDIGFAGKNMDTAALLAFCGAGNGVVAKWYDQTASGKNFEQSNPALMPKIVTSGVVLWGVSIKAGLVMDSTASSMTDFSIFVVAQKPNTADAATLLGCKTANQQIIKVNASDKTEAYLFGYPSGGDGNIQFSHAQLVSGAAWSLSRKGTVVSERAISVSQGHYPGISANAITPNFLGGFNNGSYPESVIKEIIVFDSGSATRTRTLMTDQGSAWDISGSLSKAYMSAWGDSIASYIGSFIQSNLWDDLAVCDIGAVGGESSTLVKNRIIASGAYRYRPMLVTAGRNNYEDVATVQADITTIMSSAPWAIMGTILSGDYEGEHSTDADHTKLDTILGLNEWIKSTYPTRHADIYTAMCVGSTDGVPLSIYRSDAVHPNALGQKLCADTFCSSMRNFGVVA